jgi:lactoylglutathione lyase
MVVRRRARVPQNINERVRTMSEHIMGITAVGIPVADQDRALAFYTVTLGLEKRFDMPIEQFGGRWITVAPKGSVTSIALVPAHGGLSVGVETGIRLTTPNALALHTHLKDSGVEVDELLRWDGAPAMFGFRDQDGNALEITEEPTATTRR